MLPSPALRAQSATATVFSNAFCNGPVLLEDGTPMLVGGETESFNAAALPEGLRSIHVRAKPSQHPGGREGVVMMGLGCQADWLPSLACPACCTCMHTCSRRLAHCARRIGNCADPPHPLSLSLHARMHARTHTHTHARTHVHRQARTHTHRHTHRRTHLNRTPEADWPSGT